MFFTEALQPNLQSEWAELIKDTTFEAEWNKLKVKSNLSDICVGIKLLLNIVGLKPISNELREKIILQLRSYLSPLEEVSDLYNMSNSYIMKVDYILQINNLLSQKNRITYLTGEQNLQPTSSDKFIRCFDYKSRKILKDHERAKGAVLLSVLTAGLYIINNLDLDTPLILIAQIALIACISTANSYTSAASITSFEMRENHNNIISQLKDLSPKLEQLNTKILHLEHIVSSSTRPKYS